MIRCRAVLRRDARWAGRPLRFTFTSVAVGGDLGRAGLDDLPVLRGEVPGQLAPRVISAHRFGLSRATARRRSSSIFPVPPVAIAGAATAGTRASVVIPSPPLPRRPNDRRAPGTARVVPKRVGQGVAFSAPSNRISIRSRLTDPHRAGDGGCGSEPARTRAVRFPAGVGLSPRRVLNYAAATAVVVLASARPCSWSSPRYAAGAVSSSGRPSSQALRRRSAPEAGPAGVRADGCLGEAARGRRRGLELGRGAAGRARGGVHLHPRSRSSHMSPASETWTSKRLMPGWSARSRVIQKMRASTRRRPRSARRLRRRPGDGGLGDVRPGHRRPASLKL